VYVHTVIVRKEVNHVLPGAMNAVTRMCGSYRLHSGLRAPVKSDKMGQRQRKFLCRIKSYREGDIICFYAMHLVYKWYRICLVP
jgi:hypothetical protein